MQEGQNAQPQTPNKIKNPSLRNILERKLDPILKGWSTFKGIFKWTLVQKKGDEKKLKISYLDFDS